MTVGQLIKKLAEYDFDSMVFLVSIKDDLGDSDEVLNPEAISEDSGHFLITHSNFED